MKGLCVRLRDAAAGGYKVRVVAARIDAWYHVLTVNEESVLLSAKVPLKLRLDEITALVEDEEDKAMNRKLDERSF
jgi:hypothetical protein